jgi:hypothetical protein
MLMLNDQKRALNAPVKSESFKRHFIAQNKGAGKK